MSLALIEGQYLAPILSFAHGLSVGELQLEAGETYQKGGFRARCHLAGPNGVLVLSVPLEKGKNQQQSIRETRIAYREDWSRQHWQSIRSAYGRAPYYDCYADYIEDIIRKKQDFLWDLNWELTQTIIELLQLPIKLSASQSFIKSYPLGGPTLDLRSKISFRKPELSPGFQSLKSYPQLFEDRQGFLPNLSILDLLFCTGPEAIRYLQFSETSKGIEN